MKENEPFTYLGFYENLNELVSVITSFSESDWSYYKARKNTGGIASYNTDTIPLLYSPNATNPKQMEKHQHHSIFSRHIEELCRIASKELGKVVEKQSMITRLLPGKSIKRHKDMGEITAKTHRVHLPIISNQLCTFRVEDVSLHLKPGDIWVIDNTNRYHSVDNLGESTRVHLIIDMA